MPLRFFIFILIFILLLAVPASFGQSFERQPIAEVRQHLNGPTGKGSWQLGGSASFSFQNGEYFEDENGHANFTLNISPSFGYFIKDGLELGASVLIFANFQGNNNRHGFGLGPSIAYYFSGHEKETKIQGTIIPYVSLEGFYSKSKAKDSYYGREDYFSYSDVILSNIFGINYMLSNSVSLVGALRMSHYFETVTMDRSGMDECFKYKLPTEYGLDVSLLIGVSCYIWR
jgi:hypothetical protein